MSLSADTYDLVADIGGTNTRVALAENGALLTNTVTRYKNADHKSLEDVLQRFLQSHDGVDCAGACAALAGPVKNGCGSLTNLDWTIDEKRLAEAASAEVAVLFNDLQAQGHGLDRLGTGAIRTLLDGTPEDNATRLVIGVGTGFNIAPVYQTDHGRIVPPSEAGHANLPIRDDQGMQLLKHFETAHEFPAVEDMLSGRGLERVYDYLTGQKLSAADIMQRYEVENDQQAEEAAQLFVQMLGTVAGNLSLIHLPFGGVFFAGGVARAFAPHFERLGFADAFRDKGRFSDFMKSFPVFVIEDDYAALSGCAAFLQDRR